MKALAFILALGFVASATPRAHANTTNTTDTADQMQFMDNHTPDEIAHAYGLPTTAEMPAWQAAHPESLLQNVSSIAVYIDVDLSSQRLTVQSPQGTYTFVISSARRPYHTVTGYFHPYYLQRMHYSHKYNNSPMPYSMFFDGGYAIHGTYERRELGRPASHGCVRVDPRNAEYLYSLVKTYGKANTQIYIHY